MAWEDRLREAAYTSPGGARLTFLYEAVSRETTKRTTAFQFPGVNDAYVQDNGYGPRRYPLRCFFAGADHDLDAAAFEAALLERGIGRLEHPFYGTFDVVPAGDITRRDDLRDAAAQTIIEVTFWTSVTAVYPSGQTHLRSDVLTAIGGFEEASSQEFADSVDLSTVAAQANAADAVEGALTMISAELASVAAASSSVSEYFRDAQDVAHGSLDVLVGQPLQLARQLTDLVLAPARSDAGIASRLEGYAALAARLFTSPRGRPWESFVGGVVLPGRRRTVANDFHVTRVAAAAACAGAVLSAVETQFAARPQAISAAADLLAQLDALVAWQDAGHAALVDFDAPGGIDTGASYQALQDAVALGAGYLVEISFSLLPERRVVLDRARTIIDLAAELYGSVDDRLDFLIETNRLTGSEILELPRGTTVVYYA